MPLSPPKVVVPLSACSQQVRLQGQKTGATVTVHASLSNIYDTVFEGIAHGPDEIFTLIRRLKAGENVYAKQAMPGDTPGSFINPDRCNRSPIRLKLVQSRRMPICMPVATAAHLAMDFRALK